MTLPPDQIHPDTARRMRDLIRNAIATRAMTIAEAAAEARGLRARYPVPRAAQRHRGGSGRHPARPWRVA